MPTFICSLLLIALLATVSSAAAPDSFALWQQGSFRGANVMARATVDDMRALRSWGANLAEIEFGRVADPHPPYAFSAEHLARVDHSVECAEAAGLFVVLTCRSGPGRANFDKSFEIWHDEAAQAAYAEMWRKIAEHYRGRPSIVGYDLMCEPHPEQEGEAPSGAWNKLAKRITAAIREVDKDTPIVVNSAGYGYPQRFADLEPTGDPRTIYAVHMYSPRHYTHQKPDAPVPYPGVVAKHVEPEGYWDATDHREDPRPRARISAEVQGPHLRRRIRLLALGARRRALLPGRNAPLRPMGLVFGLLGVAGVGRHGHRNDARCGRPHALSAHSPAQPLPALLRAGPSLPPALRERASPGAASPVETPLKGAEMPWCPNCRTEYRPKITHCADCGAELVEALPSEPEPPAPAHEYEKEHEEVLLCSILGETHAALVRNALRAEGIETRTQFGGIPELKFPGSIPNLVVGIYVNRRDEARAREIYEAYEGAES